MHILSMYNFHVGVKQQLYGHAVGPEPNDVIVKFNQVELDS